MSPEKEKSPLDNAQASSLPMGVQDIFATGEESDANRLVDDTSVTTPPVSGAEMMQKAVDSILLFPPAVITDEPIMSPGSPQQINEEFSRNEIISPETTFSSGPKPSPEEKISLPAIVNEALEATSPDDSATPPDETSPAAQGDPPPDVVQAGNLRFQGDSNTSPQKYGSATRGRAPSPEIYVLPLPTGAKAASPVVGMVEPSPQTSDAAANSSPDLLLHDFRPQEMLSTLIPTTQETTHSFHNIISGVFLENKPCSQKSLLQAMAASLEHKGYQILHGLQLPEDSGLQPNDPLHMALYLYISILYDEYDDHVQHEKHEKRDYQKQLSQEKKEHESTQDTLAALRKVNSLLSKSNSPAEREHIFRLQQETRKNEQALQATTQDFNEVKALSEALQVQLEAAVKHRDSAVQELQHHLSQLQSTASELSHLKIRMASMVDSDKVSAETVQLKSQIHELSLNMNTANQRLEEEAVKAKTEETKSKMSLQEKDGLLKDLEKSAERLQEAEKCIKSLKATKTELSVQVNDLSKERDTAAPMLADAKIISKKHQSEKSSWEEKKKSLCQDIEARDAKITSLKANVTSLQASLENHNKKKDKPSAEVMEELNKTKELLDQLSLDKAKLLRDAKKDGENFFSQKEAQEQRDKRHVEALKVTQDQAEALKDEASVLSALKASLEEERNSLANTVLDLQERLHEKSQKKKGKKKKVLQRLVKLLQDNSHSASDSESGQDSEDEVSKASSQKPSSGQDSPLNVNSSASPEPIASPAASKDPEKHQADHISYSEIAKRDSVSQGSVDDLEISLDPQDRFSADATTGKRQGSPMQSSSPKSARPRSTDRSVRYTDSPQREMQLHYDLDYMTDTHHSQALQRIRKYTAESAEALFRDENLRYHLRGNDSDENKARAVQTILKTYAKCVSLKDISALNNGTDPLASNCYLPIPDLSASSEEWAFIENHQVRKNFVHFPSLMALFRLYCSKLYAFFHYGNTSDQPRRTDTVNLLHTADRDNHGNKRSDYEKKIDLILILIIGRLVFYTLDDVSAFECNRDRKLYISAPFLSEDFIEQMVAFRSYRDPYLLPRRDMYHLYVEGFGARARRDFHNKISRYEPTSPSPRHPADQRQGPATSGASWMDKV